MVALSWDIGEKMNPETFTILVIDDEQLACRTLADFIEDEGFKVFTAHSAEEGLEIVVTHHIDVAIVDMRLPGLDGNAFIVQANELKPRLRFIVHTGSNAYVPPEEIRNIGVTSEFVFLKPVNDMGRICKAVDKLIQQSS